MPYSSLIRKNLEKLKEKIQLQMAAKNLDSSGQASQSLEIQGAKLLGNDYIYYLDQGRGPGGFPPISNMAEWVRRKLGLEGSEARQVAFLAARKISREGTEIYKNKSLGLELDSLIDETIEELLKETPEIAAAEALKFL